jgi:hypothetical protein
VQFLLFLFSYAVNTLILIFIPNEIAVLFLGGFTFFNIVFSLLFTFSFSKIEALRKPNKILLSTMLGVLILMVVVSRFNMVVAVACIYPFSLLYCDYIMTQGAAKNNLLYYRLFLMISGLIIALISLYDGQYFIWLVLVRSLLVMLYASIYIFKCDKFYNLKIKSPVAFILNTHILYFGSLLLIVYSNETGSAGTKYWYIALQIALGLLLKFIDFSIRKNGELQKQIAFAIIGLSGLIIMTASYLNFSLINMSISIIAVLGLSKILFGIKHE